MTQARTHITAIPGRRVLARCLGLLLASLLCACSHHGDELAGVPDPSEQWDGKYYLTLNIRVDGSGSRAGGNPWGGEEGDGSLAASANESAISDATLLLYRKSINSGTLAASDIVEYALYFDDFSLDGANYACTIPFPFELPSTEVEYKAIAIANCGDMTSTFQGMPLATLAEYKVSRAKGIWRLKAGDAGHSGLAATSYAGYLPSAFANYEYFMMSSYQEAAYTFDATTLQTLPTITVHRLAARVDVGVNTAYWDMSKEYATRDHAADHGIEFVVYQIDPETRQPLIVDGNYVDSGERYLVTNITLASSYTGNEYLLKRTADNTSGDNVEYMGTETYYADHKASNFVLMPSHSSGDYADFAFTGLGQLQYMTTPLYSSTAGAVTVDYYGLAYTRENVNDRSNYTGLILNGYYNTTGTKDAGKPTNYEHAYARDYSFPLRHSDPDGNGSELDPMHYAVVRNNIYRVYIDNVFTDQKYVYVRWYYYQNNGADEVDCTDVAFEKVVQLQPDGDFWPDDLPPKQD